MAICPRAYSQTFAEMDTGDLGYPFRKLGVAYPFYPNVYYPPKVPLCPGAHLPQIFIFPKSQFAPSSHLLQCLFALSAYLSFIRCLYAPVPICPKCRFTPNNSPYPQMSICIRAHVPYSAHHNFPNPYLPCCSFAPNAHLSQVPNCPRPKCLGSMCSESGTEVHGPILSGTIYPGTHLSRTQMYGPQLSETHLPAGAHLSWCPFVRDPNVRKPPATPHAYI